MLNTVGFVLSKKDINDLDREYCFFSKKYGKIKLLAKSVKKILSKLSAQLEPPSLISVVFIPMENKGMITTALARNSYSKIRKDIDKFKVYNHMAKIINDFTLFNQKDDKLWTLFKLTNDQLKKYPFNLVEISFMINFIKEIGFYPNLKRCSECNKSTTLNKDCYFDFDGANIVCSDCNKSKNLIKLNQQTMKSIEVLNNFDIKKIILLELDDPILKQYKNISIFLNKYLSYVKKHYCE